MAVTIYYDGDCPFCARYVRMGFHMLLAHLPIGVFRKTVSEKRCQVRKTVSDTETRKTVSDTETDWIELTEAQQALRERGHTPAAMHAKSGCGC